MPNRILDSRPLALYELIDEAWRLVAADRFLRGIPHRRHRRPGSAGGPRDREQRDAGGDGVTEHAQDLVENLGRAGFAAGREERVPKCLPSYLATELPSHL